MAAISATDTLPAHLADPRVRYILGAADWLAEREWRLCWATTPRSTPPGFIPALRLAGPATGIIVGTQGRPAVRWR
jgi:hypothetical protein